MDAEMTAVIREIADRSRGLYKSAQYGTGEVPEMMRWNG